jgi:hypothetical protein
MYNVEKKGHRNLCNVVLLKQDKDGAEANNRNNLYLFLICDIELSHELRGVR